MAAHRPVNNSSENVPRFSGNGGFYCGNRRDTRPRVSGPPQAAIPSPGERVAPKGSGEEFGQQSESQYQRTDLLSSRTLGGGLQISVIVRLPPAFLISHQSVPKSRLATASPRGKRWALPRRSNQRSPCRDTRPRVSGNISVRRTDTPGGVSLHLYIEMCEKNPRFLGTGGFGVLRHRSFHFARQKSSGSLTVHAAPKNELPVGAADPT